MSLKLICGTPQQNDMFKKKKKGSSSSDSKMITLMKQLLITGRLRFAAVVAPPGKTNHLHKYLCNDWMKARETAAGTDREGVWAQTCSERPEQLGRFKQTLVHWFICLGWCESCQSKSSADKTTRQTQSKKESLGLFQSGLAPD